MIFHSVPSLGLLAAALIQTSPRRISLDSNSSAKYLFGFPIVPFFRPITNLIPLPVYVPYSSQNGRDGGKTG